jgi:3-hydroxyisobutyrate dehydrogenase-like beta-hydroxyacid dehydrogenase
VTDGPRVGLIGLGAMGGPMARLLLGAGHSLAVHDERQEASEPLAEAGAVMCASPRAVADTAEIVFASLPTPDVMREVALGDEGVVRGATVRTFVDLSTTGTTTAEEVAAVLAGQGIDYVDAPVSGGVAGINARTLAVMASGDRGAFERVRPLFEVFAANIIWVGPAPGQGQTAKLLNNLLSATAMAITSEALTLGVQAGLDAATLLDVFNAGSGRNTATTDKFPKHVLTGAFASGFRLRLMTKDVELCLAEARRRHVPMLVGSTVQQLWTLAAAQAGEADDHTEIVRLFEEWSGVRIAVEAAVDAGA